MSNSNKPNIMSDVLIADVMLRLQALQNILIRKEIISNDELQKEIKIVSKTILKSVLEKANVAGDLDKLIEDLEIVNKKDLNS